MNAVAMTAVVSGTPADGPSTDGQGTGAAFGEALGLAGRSFAQEQASAEESGDTPVEDAASSAVSPTAAGVGQSTPADPGSTFAAALLLSVQPVTRGAADAEEGAILPAQGAESAPAAVGQPATVPPTAVVAVSGAPAGAPAGALAGTPAAPIGRTTPASADVPTASTAAAGSAGLPGDGEGTATMQGATSAPTVVGRSSSSDTAPTVTASPGVPSSGDADSDAAARRSVPVAEARASSEARITDLAHPEAAATSSVEQRPRVDGVDRTSTAAPATPAASTVAPVISSAAVPTVMSAEPEAALASGARAVATQVSPVLLSIVQRPAGSHQLTMTVNPDSLGPVTLRAHISAGGDVQVELVGATDAGREALRLIATDLRRDLASVMPHATLTLGQGAAAETGGDRSGQPNASDLLGDQGSDRGTRHDESTGSRSAAAGDDRPRIIQTTSRAGVGEGLDIFA